jgi:hypothetical protein
MIKIRKIKSILKTIHHANQSLIKNKMSGLIPFFLGLMVFALLMVFINSVSPLAPFVYSLF